MSKELTVGRLKMILNRMRDDAIIQTEQNEDFVHIFSSDTLILSTTRPIGVCNRTGTYVYPSVVDQYAGFCPELDEDLFSHEFKLLDKKEDG